MKDFLRALALLGLAGRLLGLNSASHSVLACMLQTHPYEHMWGVILKNRRSCGRLIHAANSDVCFL